MAEQQKLDSKKDKTTKRPVIKIDLGSVHISGWENTRKTSKGKEFKVVDFSLQYSYFDSNEKTTKYLKSFPGDTLLVLSLVCEQAFLKYEEYKLADRKGE